MPCVALALPLPAAGWTKPPVANAFGIDGDGRLSIALIAAANRPKAFVAFDSSHGIDPTVDTDLVGRLTQIYGP